MITHTKKCKRCHKPTNRPAMADYCWDCKPIIETENRHKREQKKAKLQATT